MLEIYNNFKKEYPKTMMTEYKKILSSDFVYDEVGTGMMYNSQEGFFDSLKGWKNAFPNDKITIRRTIRNGNIVFHEITCTGKHDGLFNMPGYDTTASGKDVKVREVMILDFDKAGKVKKCTLYFDTFGMMKAIGAVPAARME
uniref:SnoaL-like domain-containing protein n=1 Tax=Ditylum brightwellii TaxID=49249 RepID=A0A7S4VLS1_9STRA